MFSQNIIQRMMNCLNAVLLRDDCAKNIRSELIYCWCIYLCIYVIQYSYIKVQEKVIIVIKTKAKIDLTDR